MTFVDDDGTRVARFPPGGVAPLGALVLPAFRNDEGLEFSAAAFQLAGCPLSRARNGEDYGMGNALQVAEQTDQRRLRLRSWMHGDSSILQNLPDRAHLGRLVQEEENCLLSAVECLVVRLTTRPDIELARAGDETPDLGIVPTLQL